MEYVHVPDITKVDDDLLHRWWLFNCVLEREEKPEDDPMSEPQFAAWFRNIEPTTLVSSTLAIDDDANSTVIAEGSAWLSTAGENPHLLRTQINVVPNHRNRGIGMQLLRGLVEQAERNDRTLMTTWTSSTVPAGEDFARKLGADAVLRSHTNRLLFENADRQAIKTWVEDGPTRAADYELEWIDVAALKENDYPELIECLDLITTMPTEDLDAENERHTPEWITSRLARNQADGTEWWFLAARHRATNTRVGFTDITWNPNKPHVVWQGGTAVDPPHRGHALGKWLKAAMFERITNERPQVTEIRTGNADSNAAMLGINHAMGFEPWISHTTWQIRTERAREYLDSR